MNIQEYISSGIIEYYVLGLCDEKENTDFERICGKYPEVKSARETFEQQLEDFMISQGIQPPKHLKSRIFAHIEIESEKKEGIRHHEGNISNVHPRINWLRYLAAAAMILLFVSTALNFYFFNQLRSAEHTMNALRTVEQRQKGNLSKATEGSSGNGQPAIKGAEITEIKLKPVKGKSDRVAATILQSDEWSELVLLFHETPPATTDTWYQLWAIVSGKPVNAGRFTLSESDALIRLKNVAADSFAITVSSHGNRRKDIPGQVYIAGNKKH